MDNQGQNQDSDAAAAPAADPMAEMQASLRPYSGRLEVHTALPAHGVPRDQVLAEIEQMAAAERDRWQSGHSSGAVYQGDAEHIDFLNRVYALQSQNNPLHLDIWPSGSKFEAEIVAMTAAMLGSGKSGDEIVGTVNSGGTESILLAMKAYRDRGRERDGLRNPRVVAPDSAHAAFDKAAQYFQIDLVRVPAGADYRADVAAMAAAINDQTVAVVGSAPGFPHGLIDPIEELSELARERGIGMHVDACLGGFVLPWAERLGYDVSPFDFRLPGVTSMSCDTHKFGYAAKGTSVVLYRDAELRHHQFFTATEWPGGIYASPTFAGSRPGALSAACWAALISIGEEGYMRATKAILEAAAKIKAGIAELDELEVIGDPLFCVAFRATREDLDIYRVMDAMSERRWSLNGLHRPRAVHICTTLRHTQPGVAERFVEDLRAAIAEVKANPGAQGGMAPLYGMAATLPEGDMVANFLKSYMDMWFKP
ncbi:MAG: aminotransferase class V-fold PLP-dependent enzyme [Thermoleophilia bacterium]|nr:aminotransferase class V-fold PLP-dependent enzyme [Thermoleophilia bacterium]